MKHLASFRPFSAAIAAVLAISGEAADAEVNRWTPRGPLGAELRAVAVGPPPAKAVPVSAAPFALYVAAGGRVLRSLDAGVTWKPVFKTSGRISHLVSDPVASGVLYAAVTNVGIFKITEGGRTWGLLDGPGAIRCCVDTLALDPNRPEVLYASDFRELLRSVDGGVTWFALGDGATPDGSLGALAVDPHASATLYAGGRGGRFFRSLDGGHSWEEHGTGLDDGFHSLAVDPADPGKLYAAVSFGKLFESRDGGSTWSPKDVPPAQWIHGVAAPASVPGTLFAATAAGLLHNLDGGGSWSNLLDRGVTGLRVNALAFDPGAADTVYLASTGVFRSTDGGAGWTSLNQGLSDLTVLALAVDPDTPETLYAGTLLGGVFKSTGGGATWKSANAGRQSSATILAIDPWDPRTIYADGIAGRIYKSTDGAASWSLLEGSPSVDALVVDPHVPGTLYAGSDALYGGISKSLDGGLSWIDLDSGFESTRVNALAIDPRTPGTVYAGTDLGGAARILKSVDGGVAWTPSGDGIHGHGVRSLAVDPVEPSTLYAGTRGAGVFRSLDGGASWTPWDRGLAGRYVDALALHPQDPSRLLAGTSDQGAFEITAVPMSVGDRVWIDKDGDGLQDAEERGMEGLRVTLTDPARGVFEHTTTGVDGAFRFEWIPPGSYSLSVFLPAAFPAQPGPADAGPASAPARAIYPPFPTVPLFAFSPRDRGLDDAQDSDVDPATGSTPIRSLVAGEHDATVDFGLVPAAVLPAGSGNLPTPPGSR